MENCQRVATNIFPNTKCENVGHFRVNNPKGWSLKHETLHVETVGSNMLIDSNWFCLMPKSYTSRSAPTSLGRPYFLPAIGALFIEDECVELPNKSVLSIIDYIRIDSPQMLSTVTLYCQVIIIISDDQLSEMSTFSQVGMTSCLLDSL